MVVDARLVNRMHRKPPISKLASANVYNDLDLDFSDLVKDDGFGPGNGELGGFKLCGNELICVIVYGIFLSRSWPTGSELTSRSPSTSYVRWASRSTPIYSPEVGRQVPVEGSTILYPVIRGMSMGWSWALYFANEAVNEMVARARGGDHDWLLRERTPLPRLRVDRPVGGVYVDNITLLGI